MGGFIAIVAGLACCCVAVLAYAWMRSRRRGPRPLVVENFIFQNTIKVDQPITTPLGGKVTVLMPTLDVEFVLVDGAPVVKGVRLARVGTSINGSAVRTNMASKHRGEAWHQRGGIPQALLWDLVQRELRDSNSPLASIMVKKWRGTYPHERGDAIASAIGGGDAAAVARALASNIGGTLAIDYTSSDGSRSTRTITVAAVTDGAVRARDHADGKVKTFRLDRITGARRAP